jgi:ESCRT-II complex subunit VPS22
MAHRRRTVGIAGLTKQTQHKETFHKVGSQIEVMRMKQMQEQLDLFRNNLEDFALKYKKSINQNPEFRKQFLTMCAAIGVDPLASKKGFWAEVLGVGDFYFHLGVQIIEVCMRTRSANGGLIDLTELQRHLQKMHARRNEISMDDIERAVKHLRELGEGFNILSVGSKKMLQSVPSELNNDHTTVLALAQEEERFYVTASLLMKTLKWNSQRINSVIEFLLQEGIAWVDDQAPEGECRFYFLSLINQNNLSAEPT